MYQAVINQYIEKHPVFTVNEIQTDNKLPVNKHAGFNTELARMEKNGTIKRLSHGIYAVPQETCFGVVLPNEHEIAKHIYIKNGNGYTSGPTFLNQIGVSTWLPQKTYLKANNAKKNLGLKYFVVEEPRIKITPQNAKYLQLLDGLLDLSKFAVDNKAPYKCFYDHICENNMDIPKLFLLCHKYYKRTIENHLFEMLEDYYETT